MLCSSPAATFQLPSGARGEWSVVLRELMHKRASSDGAERAIADYLIAHRSQLGVLNARGIAAEVHVAPSTVVRFCQRLGVSTVTPRFGRPYRRNSPTSSPISTRSTPTTPLISATSGS